MVDFFAGSSSTAHAVMQLNADDNGGRKFIMVQAPEAVKPGSEARRQGYRTIDQIGIERIERAAKAIQKASPLAAGNIDFGFKLYRLTEAP